MGTKNNPGRFDCYANADRDEPMFILLGRDQHAHTAVRKWADDREHLINVGVKPESDRAMVAEARECADAMLAYHRRLKETSALSTNPPIHAEYNRGLEDAAMMVEGGVGDRHATAAMARRIRLSKHLPA